MTKYKTNQAQELRIVIRMDNQRAKDVQGTWNRLFRPTLKAHRSEFSSKVAMAFFAAKQNAKGGEINA